MTKKNNTKFRILDHTADIAVQVFGKTLEELFINSHKAFLAITVNNFPNQSKDNSFVELSANSMEDLLVDFLSEINYLLHAKKWIVTEIIDLSIREVDSLIELRCNLQGGIITLSESLKEEIKAVTYHKMNITRNECRFETTIVFDT